MTDFSTAMQLTPTGERRWSADLPADWAQGRTTFGGLIAALAARVAVQVVGAERQLRTMDVAFVAPLAPGRVELEIEVLGQGKAVTQLVVSIRSAGELGCRVHVVAGAPRVSGLRVDTAPAELLEGDPATQGIDFPYVPGVSPEFCQHIEYRWCSDAFPFSGGGPETARLKGWARHRSAATGLEATIALLDSWPPVILPMATGRIPASTVRWAIHLAGLNDLSDQELAEVDAAAQWFWYEAQTVQAADGYATATAAMYADGRLLAWSEQLIAVYDRPAVEVPDAPAAEAEIAEAATPA
jgi:acyl-CoA thioesterase